MSDNEIQGKNLLWWQKSIKEHLESDYYDVAGFIADERRLTPGRDDIDLLQPLAKKKILHLQCNFGLDTISFARLGAEAYGADICCESLDAARELAVRCLQKVEFRQWDANSQYLCDIYGNKCFDVVTTSFGVLEWIADLNTYFRQIYEVLEEGGLYHISEVHPLAKWVLRNQGEGNINYIDAGSYTEAGKSYVNGEPYGEIQAWYYPLCTIITALLKAGLSIEYFNEDTSSSYRFHRNMVIENGRWVWPKLAAGTPLIFTLLARKLSRA